MRSNRPDLRGPIRSPRRQGQAELRARPKLIIQAVWAKASLAAGAYASPLGTCRFVVGGPVPVYLCASKSAIWGTQNEASGTVADPPRDGGSRVGRRCLQGRRYYARFYPSRAI